PKEDGPFVRSTNLLNCNLDIAPDSMANFSTELQQLTPTSQLWTPSCMFGTLLVELFHSMRPTADRATIQVSPTSSRSAWLFINCTYLATAARVSGISKVGFPMSSTPVVRLGWTPGWPGLHPPGVRRHAACSICPSGHRLGRGLTLSSIRNWRGTPLTE